jgi:hypothetical protein
MRGGGAPGRMRLDIVQASGWTGTLYVGLPTFATLEALLREIEC